MRDTMIYVYRGWIITWRDEILAVDYYGWDIKIANLEEMIKLEYTVIFL